MAKYIKYEIKKGSRWRVQGYLGLDPTTSKQININKQGFKTKKEAQTHFNREKYKFDNHLGGGVKRENPLYSDLYTEWFEQYKNTVKVSTVVKTKQLFNNHILPSFGNLKIKKINSSYLQRQLNKWHKQFAQYRKVFNYTNKILDYAVLHGYLEQNPKNRVVVPTNKVGVSATISDNLLSYNSHER